MTIHWCSAGTRCWPLNSQVYVRRKRCLQRQIVKQKWHSSVVLTHLQYDGRRFKFDNTHLATGWCSTHFWLMRPSKREKHLNKNLAKQRHYRSTVLRCGCPEFGSMEKRKPIATFFASTLCWIEDSAMVSTPALLFVPRCAVFLQGAMWYSFWRFRTTTSQFFSMVKFGIFWQLGAGDVMLKYWDVVVTMVSLLLSACKQQTTKFSRKFAIPWGNKQTSNKLRIFWGTGIEHIDAGSWKINLRLKVLKVHDPEFVILWWIYMVKDDVLAYTLPNISLEPQTTSLKWMFGETTISHLKIWNHPIESTTKKWFRVPGAK